MHAYICTNRAPPYLQCTAISETKGSLDELATFNYMYIQSTSNTEHFLRRNLCSISWVTVDDKIKINKKVNLTDRDSTPKTN